MGRDLSEAVAHAPRTEVHGTFERHVAIKWVPRALEGSAAGGRWGAEGEFAVIYLGRPTAAVVAEAYRHLVDPIEGMTPERVRGRRLIRAKVDVTGVLDLRDHRSWRPLGIAEDDLTSDVGDYEACQLLGSVAHQLGFHGVLAPAATGLGETLALFVDLLPPEELPVALGDPVDWLVLPPDPRRLRVVGPQRATGKA